MAATNRLDVIDDAILRPGRFDRHIQVNLPDIKEREAILKIHARNKNLSSKVNLEDIAVTYSWFFWCTTRKRIKWSYIISSKI